MANTIGVGTLSKKKKGKRKKKEKDAGETQDDNRPGLGEKSIIRAKFEEGFSGF